MEMVDEYMKNQKKIAMIKAEAEESEKAITNSMKGHDDLYYEKQRTLDAEKHQSYAVLNTKLTAVKAECTEALKPLWDQANQVKHIISLLRIAETIQPIKDIEDSEITPYHKETYFEWLGLLYKDDFMKIRLLIAENRKPRNRYSLIAYGRSVFKDDKLLRPVYTYGTPNLNDHSGGFCIRYEIGCFPSIKEIKTFISKFPDKKDVETPEEQATRISRYPTKPLRTFIFEFELLKAEYLEVTGKYKLSDFEPITVQEKAKEGSK